MGLKGLISFWMMIGMLKDEVVEEQTSRSCTAEGRARLYSHDRDSTKVRRHLF